MNRQLPIAITATGCRLQLKSGRTSAPRFPRIWHTYRASMSDSLLLSGQPSPLVAIEWLQR
jgi:hypothetical protein